MIDIVQWLGFHIYPGYGGHNQEYLRLVSVNLGSLDGGGIFKLTCDFGGSKTHARRLRVCGTKDSIYIDDREPTNKGVVLKQFIHGLERGFGSDGELAINRTTEIFRVHEIGLSL